MTPKTKTDISAGDVFGKLTTIRKVFHIIKQPYNGKLRQIHRWLCACECGTVTKTTPYYLRKGQGQCRSCSAKNRNITYTYRENITTTHGYVLTYSPKHPNAHSHNSRVYQHTLVMEEHIGRYLTDKETVHHKNGIRDDNRIKNLELWVSNHPAGQRVQDKIEHAIEIIARYGDEYEINQAELGDVRQDVWSG